MYRSVRGRLVDSRLRTIFATSLLLAASPLSAANAPLTPASLSSAAGENYVIHDSQGYGIGECMHAGSDCGRVMADSWCEAHGHAHALAYGTGEDVTGSVASNSAVAPVTASDVVISCGD